MLKIESKKAFFLLTATLIVLALIQILSSSIGNLFFINLSSSMPKGVYIKSGLNKIKKGDLVSFTVPSEYKDYDFLDYKKTILKEVYAISGDKYCITYQGITVNGKLIAKSKQNDFQGKSILKKLGCHTIKANYLLPLSLHSPNSFDGRYFGQIKIDPNVKKVKKLFIFKFLSNFS